MGCFRCLVCYWILYMNRRWQKKLQKAAAFITAVIALLSSISLMVEKFPGRAKTQSIHWLHNALMNACIHYKCCHMPPKPSPMVVWVIGLYHCLKDIGPSSHLYFAFSTHNRFTQMHANARYKQGLRPILWSLWSCISSVPHDSTTVESSFPVSYYTSLNVCRSTGKRSPHHLEITSLNAKDATVIRELKRAKLACALREGSTLPVNYS